MTSQSMAGVIWFDYVHSEYMHAMVTFESVTLIPRLKSFKIYAKLM